MCLSSKKLATPLKADPNRILWQCFVYGKRRSLMVYKSKLLASVISDSIYYAEREGDKSKEKREMLPHCSFSPGTSLQLENVVCKTLIHIGVLFGSLISWQEGEGKKCWFVSQSAFTQRREEKLQDSKWATNKAENFDFSLNWIWQRFVWMSKTKG